MDPRNKTNLKKHSMRSDENNAAYWKSKKYDRYQDDWEYANYDSDDEDDYLYDSNSDEEEEGTDGGYWADDY